MKLLLLLFLAVSVQCVVCLVNVDGNVQCEPRHLKYINRRFWMSSYPFHPISLGFDVAIIHRSNMTYPDKIPAIVENVINATKVHQHYTGIILYQTQHLYSPRKTSSTIIYNFESGDAAVMHVFNPWTKTYTRNELGFHTNKFFFVVEAGEYYSLDIPMHREEKYALISSVAIRHSASAPESFYEFIPKETILEEFPEEEELIDKLYTNVGYIRT